MQLIPKKLFGLALIVLLWSGTGYAETLNIAVHEFCPYLCKPEKENGKEGYVAEVLRAIYEPKGFKLVFDRVPYVRGIRSTEQGIYDGMPMLNSQSSDKIVLSKELCGILVQNFYVKKGNPWKYTGLNSLENILVGSIIGYNYSPLDPDYESYLRKYSKTEPKRVFYVASENPTLSNLKMIQTDRITTFNECSYVVEYIINKENLGPKFEVAGTLGILKNYMGISPKRPDVRELTAVFDVGIQRLRKTGRLSAILKDYGLADWQKEAP